MNWSESVGKESFQSTLPRGSDGTADDDKVFGYQISIHAPSRERPEFGELPSKIRAISIHAPSRERPRASIS